MSMLSRDKPFWAGCLTERERSLLCRTTGSYRPIIIFWSRQIVDEICADCTEEEKAKIAGDNCARMYHMEVKEGIGSAPLGSA